MQILWAGSSSTYFHNMPKVCAEWLTQFGGVPASSRLVGRSGTGIHVYLQTGFQAEYGLEPGQTVLEKIASRNFDCVVLQVPAEFINGPEGTEHDQSLDVYCRAIREAGGTPVFYEMGWGQDEIASTGRKKIFAAAVRNRVTHFAPCSTAWRRVRQERPELELHNPPDTTHPGTLGCYLNLCCLFAAVTGKPPAGLPLELTVWQHPNDQQKTAAEGKLLETQFDEYDNLLPDWMKRRAVMSEPRRLDEETAQYLQNVAWAEYQEVRARLTQALGNAPAQQSAEGFAGPRVGVGQEGKSASASPTLRKHLPKSLVIVGSPLQATQQILADWNASETGDRIEELGKCLAVNADMAEDVLAWIAKQFSIEATTLRAELLLWIAEGEPVKQKGSPAGNAPQQVMATDRLGQLAGELLEHPDPFVRGSAEWAIAIRLGAEYEGTEEKADNRRVVREWPGENAPAWYRRWSALGADAMVTQDYVRQAASLGWHRTSAGLIDSAKKLADRAGNLAAYVVQRGTPEQAAAARAGLDRVHADYAKLVEMPETPSALTALRVQWLALRLSVRKVALANPDIAFHNILFGLRQAAPTSGNITAGRWNTHTPGGDIVIKSGLEPDDPVRPLLNGRLGPGHVRGLDLHWDADRVVFAFARQPDRVRELASGPVTRAKGDLGGYFGNGTQVEELSHLFAMNIDGSDLRQLTDARYHADQEPCYLPNGDIVFVSDRSNFGSQCAGALDQDNMILNLYRCNADGTNLQALSNNKDFDRHPHMMDNGQILFLHWEYQERHLWQTHSLWTCRPDGSLTDALYKQHIEGGPMSLREARQVAGQRQVAAIACGHHNFDQGAVVLADYARGVNDPAGMTMVTPGVSTTEGGYGRMKPVPEGGVEDGGGHYMFPYPLSDKSFLVAYSYKRPERLAGQNYALYYIDVWGNKELVHRDKRLSVAYLMPLCKTKRPSVLPELAPPSPAGPRYALAAVADVQAGWPQIPAGTVKYLRVSQKVPWPCVRDEDKTCGFNDLHWMPAAWEPVLGMWDWGTARVIGIVPVEADGSAYFKVPADQTVYFQALDKNFLEVRRMRSNVTFRAGETRSCIGCHESKALAPPARQIPLAMLREPSWPVPPPWGNRIVPDFEQHIQPIFDRHCVRCHGETSPDGGLEFSARRLDGYLQSYRTIFGLAPDDRTPVTKGYWAIWHPGEPPLDDKVSEEGKTFLKSALRTPPAGQLVALADYMGGAEVTEPFQFGSAKSTLTLTLLKDRKHREEVQLTPDEWLALVTWVDLNAQYWGTFVEKDAHFASRRAALRGGRLIPPRRVLAVFPDPWSMPPAGDWIWRDSSTVVLEAAMQGARR